MFDHHSYADFCVYFYQIVFRSISPIYSALQSWHELLFSLLTFYEHKYTIGITVSPTKGETTVHEHLGNCNELLSILPAGDANDHPHLSAHRVLRLDPRLPDRFHAAIQV